MLGADSYVGIAQVFFVIDTQAINGYIHLHAFFTCYISHISIYICTVYTIVYSKATLILRSSTKNIALSFCLILCNFLCTHEFRIHWMIYKPMALNVPHLILWFQNEIVWLLIMPKQDGKKCPSNVRILFTTFFAPRKVNHKWIVDFPPSFPDSTV